MFDLAVKTLRLLVAHVASGTPLSDHPSIFPATDAELVATPFGEIPDFPFNGGGVMRLRALILLSAISLCVPATSWATNIDFSSGTWNLAAANSDSYAQNLFLVSTANGAVDPNSPANGTWGWGNHTVCTIGCGTTTNTTTVTYNQGLDFFDFLKVTILENDAGMTFTADGGHSITFAAGDVGLKTLNWKGISVLQITHAEGTSVCGSCYAYDYIDNLQMSAVPEPGVPALLSIGLVGFATQSRRRKRLRADQGAELPRRPVSPEPLGLRQPARSRRSEVT